jgi:CTP:molybdopterin cytidylyltransferase MocA
MRRIIPRPWVVLLAAGGSRRFGRPKLLATIDGETLLRRAARVALGCAPSGCIIVLGSHASRLRCEVHDLRVHIVVNRHWRTGLASSLSAGIMALPRNSTGALILLADQVAIGPADLELAFTAWRTAPASIIATRASGVLGPPAILPRRLFPRLRRLRGDRGAQGLLRDHSRPVIALDLPAAGRDVDRPGDLGRLRRSQIGRRRK